MAIAFSYQLYSSRAFPPLERTLAMLAAAGYGGTEGFAGVYGDPAATRAAHDRAGLVMTSGHFLLDAVESDPDGTLAIAEALGLSSIYAPSLPADERPADAAGWTAFGHRLEALAERYAAHGIHFGWHNHDFEFRPLADGSVPMGLILDAAPSIGWEADIAWIVRAGGDPFRWIAEHGHRITAVHIKDIAPDGECADEGGWSDVGEGTVDWPALMTALKDAPVRHYVLEHDKPNDDARFARRSLAAVRALEG